MAKATVVIHLGEIVGRVVVVYVACLVLLRITGRRAMSSLGPMDLLAMLLLSETVSPSMTAGDDSLTTGIVAATTLLALCWLSDRLSHRSRRFEHFIEGEAVVLIEGGRVRDDVLRRFTITQDELSAKLHDEGLLSVREVKRAFIEPDGQITIVPQTR